MMMGNHGAVCYGEDVYKAFFRMETVEHFARISLVAELLGGATVLPRGGSGETVRFAYALRREGAQPPWSRAARCMLSRYAAAPEEKGFT